MTHHGVPAPGGGAGDDGHDEVQDVERRRSMWICALIGVGLMAAVDEIVFHQLLSWHHLYDRSTTEVALLSDGILHAAELVLLVAAFVLYAGLQHRRSLARRSAWAGLLLGLGGFQLWDGVVDHKVLRLHQIRYGVDLLAYDVAWNATGLSLLLVGLVLARHDGPRRSGRTRTAR